MTIFRDLTEERELVESFTKPAESLLPVSRLRDDPAGETGRWKEVAALGWLGVTLPEEGGGIGLSAVEEVLAAQTFGRCLISTAYPATVLAAHAFDKMGKGDVVEALLSGDARAALAGPADHTGQRVAIDAEGADYLVALSSDAIELFAASAMKGYDDEHWGRPVALTVAGEPLLRVADETLVQRARLIFAALLAGIATEACNRGVDYAKVREQFGQPIGAFQAIKHHCANMAIAAHAARELVTSAALAFVEGEGDAALAADGALNFALRAARDNAGINIQVHGGMGFSAECDAHLFLKGTLLLDAACGGLGGTRRRLLPAG